MIEPQINTEFLGFFGKLPKRTHKPTAIVIHHTCSSKPERTRKSLKSKGYSTHFEVGTDGTIFQYADVDDVCSHCGSANIHAIGIDVTHLKDASFPDKQVEAVKELVAFLCKKYGIEHEVHEQLSGIYPHKAIGNTACPQNFPMKELNKE